MGTHFIGYNGEYHIYNDQSVTESSFNEVRQNGPPYALFYIYI